MRRMFESRRSGRGRGLGVLGGLVIGVLFLNACSKMDEAGEAAPPPEVTEEEGTPPPAEDPPPAAEPPEPMLPPKPAPEEEPDMPDETVTLRHVMAPADPAGEPPPSKDYHTVDVFYATDRKPEGGDGPNRRYGKERHRAGPMEYGRTEISIPKGHQIGVVERPKWYKLEFSEDPKKHVTILELEKLSPGQYFEQVNVTAGERPLREALLFIHGFNVTFDEAVRRTGQIAFDLDFGGVALTFSWPSQGSIGAYTVDEDNATWAIPHLSQFLVDLQRKTDLDKIHVIAHSMGTRVLSYALARARDDGFDLDLNNVILAAPDIDADVFKDQILPKIQGAAKRMTMYASSGDTALQVSQRINGNDRLGLSGDRIMVLEGIDTVDASEIDTSMIGHGYYGSHKVVVEDILNLIIRGLDPPNRELVPGEVGEWDFRKLVN